MKYRPRTIVGCTVMLFLLASLVSAQEVDLDQFRDEHPVIIVFSRNQDDERPFQINLDLSTAWSGVTARDIQVVDVDPISHDVNLAAEQLELGSWEFAVVLIARDGTTLLTTDEDIAVDELFQILDDYQRGDR
ncbi:MAG: DUF4174 domain-containing protein [Alkalispirochaeta sp.]